MKAIKPLLYLFLSGFIVVNFSCSKDRGSDELINPDNPNEIAAALQLPGGSQVNNGALPSPSNSSNSPQILADVADFISSNGATLPLSASIQNINGNPGSVLAQVDGSGTFFEFPSSVFQQNSSQVQIPIGIPVNVDSGEFCITLLVVDQNGLASNKVNTCIQVLRLGTGAVQVSLSWDTPTDQDLYVTDPSGETIYFGNDNSASGGSLDRDDVNGYGPENIFWSGDNAPDGVYEVEVDDYEGTSSPNHFYVTVSGSNTSKRFSGFTRYGSKEFVVSFTKNGDNISF